MSDRSSADRVAMFASLGPHLVEMRSLGARVAGGTGVMPSRALPNDNDSELVADVNVEAHRP